MPFQGNPLRVQAIGDHEAGLVVFGIWVNLDALERATGVNHTPISLHILASHRSFRVY